MTDSHSSGSAAPLTWEVFVAPELDLVSHDTPPDNAVRTWAPISATLISGVEDAVLVDAMLTADQARALGDWVAAKGKNLTAIYVTHGHGDHFFGLGHLLGHFPGARAVATSSAIELMREQSDPAVVRDYWEAILPGRIPAELRLPEPLDGRVLELEGYVLNAVEAGHTDCAGSTFLHVPSVGLVVAGDTVYNDTHIFLGDADARARNLWRAALDAIAPLAPATVIAGHKPVAGDDSPRHIEGTREYLNAFDAALATARDAADLYAAMLRAFPNHLSPGTLWSSAEANTASR